MNFKNRLKEASLLSITCVSLALATTGCSQGKNQDTQAEVASGSTTTASYDPSYSRFTPITPDQAQASTFNYKVYEFADDNSWISIIPMPPKSSDVVVEVNVPGNYEVKLTNEKCASPVNVSPSIGNPFVLTAANPKYKIAANKGMRLRIAMDETAPNNYFCNVAVAVTDQ